MSSRKELRQANILSILKTATTEGFTTTEIHTQLINHYQDRSERKTIERDIVDLTLTHGVTDSGFELHPERYRLSKDFGKDDFHNLRMNEEHLQTLLLALGILKKIGPSYFGHMVDDVRKKLDESLPPVLSDELKALNKKIVIADAVPGQSPLSKKQNETLQKVISHLRMGEPFHCYYADDETKMRTFRPFLLEMVGNSPYFLVEDFDTKGPKYEIKRIKASRIHRVSCVSGGTTPISSYKDPAPKRYQDRLSSFGALGGGDKSLRPQHVEITVKELVGHYFEDHVFHSSQKIKWNEKTAKISFHITIGFPFIRLIAGFADNIINLKPATLKTELLQHLKDGIASIK